MWSFCRICSVASAYLTDSPFIWHKHNIWDVRGQCVLHHLLFKISKAKVVRVARVARSLRCGRTSRSKSLWRRYMPCSLRRPMPVWSFGLNINQGVTFCHARFPAQKVKGQSHAGRSKLLPCLIRGSVPIRLIRLICATNTASDGLMCSALFPGQKAKGQCHVGHSSIYSSTYI